MKDRKVIYITGPDGSGKTTIAKKISRRLQEKNYETAYRWMRFNHITSKVVNGLGRLTGLSEKVKYNNNVVVGYHYYFKSLCMSWLYIVTTFIDFLLVYPYKISIPMMTRKIIIIDRFVYDILVDLMIDTGIDTLCYRWPGRILRKFIPDKSICFFLEVDIDKIHKRKPDTAYDKTHKKRHDFYKRISKEFDINIVKNNGSIESTIDSILNLI